MCCWQVDAGGDDDNAQMVVFIFVMVAEFGFVRKLLCR